MKGWLSSCLAASWLLTASVASATFHTFQIAELYSNADGTVQYVVLHEAQGMDGQNMLMGLALTSTHAGVKKTYIFPNDLPGGTSGGYYGYPMPSPTANERVLIATPGFVALGLVTPDYVIPNGFLATGGGTVDYAGVHQITYTGLPIDGGNALYSNGSAAPNVATNFSGNSASVTPPPVLNFQGLWWNAPAGSEDGWGINFAHQGDIIFATWFTYDLSGRGWWLVMTAGKTANNTYSGTLYQTHGPAFNAMPFAPKFVATPVGTGTLTFSDANNGTFNYTVNGSSPTQPKPITRQLFGPLPTCTYGAQPNLALATNYQDLWWNAPATSEDGWGINVNHEGDKIFATWFTYDLDGTPLWLVVSAPKTALGTYEGKLYRTTGPAFNAVPFAPKFVATEVGSAKFTFADGNHATFEYTVQLAGMPMPVPQIKQITRQLFTATATTCQ